MILQDQVWKPWGMNETQFGPVKLAVPTVRGVEAGIVHDPKARLLGRHAGSAGLFSTVKDLQIFLEHYLKDDFARDLSRNFSPLDDKERSLAMEFGRRMARPYGLYGYLYHVESSEERSGHFPIESYL